MGSQFESEPWEPGKPWTASATGGFSCLFFCFGVICFFLSKSFRIQGGGWFNFSGCLPLLFGLISLILGAGFGFRGLSKSGKSFVSWIGLILNSVPLIALIFYCAVMNYSTKPKG
jgi:hypothetical protein